MRRAQLLLAAIVCVAVLGWLAPSPTTTTAPLQAPATAAPLPPPLALPRSDRATASSTAPAHTQRQRQRASAARNASRTSPLRLLCVVVPNEDARELEGARVMAAYLALARRCDAVRLYASHDEPDAAMLPTAADGDGVDAAALARISVHRCEPSGGLRFWQRRRYETRCVLRAVAADAERGAFDWLVKVARPDVWLSVANLRALLAGGGGGGTGDDSGRWAAPQRRPLSAGHVLEHAASGRRFHYALTAYALSAAYVRALAPLVDAYDERARCAAAELGADGAHTEDDLAGVCGAYPRLAPNATRDARGRDYMFPFHVRDHAERMLEHNDDWYWHGKRRDVVGANCCAARPVAYANYAPAALRRLYAASAKLEDDNAAAADHAGGDDGGGPTLQQMLRAHHAVAG